MFLGNEEKMYILDKAEGNAVQINGHPAWGAVWSVLQHTSFKPMQWTYSTFISGI
jgi:hypothetical protein